MATQVLRPNADIGANAIIVGGAGSVHATLSDDSDATFMQHANAEFTYTNIDDLDPAADSPALIKSVQLGVRALVLTGSADIRYRLNTDYGWLDTQITALSNTATDYNGPAVDPIVGATELTWADLNNAKYRIDSYNTGASKTIRNHEASVTVVYVAQPVATVTPKTPNPWVSSSSPPQEWTSVLDADGGSQTNAQVRILNDSISGGFNDPTFSESLLESWAGAVASTDIVGSAEQWTPPPLLSNGTFRTYVRVAQTVRGITHWSEWAHDEYELIFDVHDVTAMLVESQNQYGRIKLTVTGEPSPTPAWEVADVQRSVDDGSWEYVRGGYNIDRSNVPESFVEVVGDLLVIYDHEVPSDSPVKYRARFGFDPGSGPIVGDWVESGQARWAANGTHWLKCPTVPAVNTPVVPIRPTNPTNRAQRHGNYQVIGRRNAVIVTDVVAGLTWDVTIRALNLDEYRTLMTLIETGGTFLFDFPTTRLGANRDGVFYGVVTNTVDGWLTDGWWSDARSLTLTVVEVDAPADETMNL